MLRGPVLFLLVLYAVCGLTVAGSTSLAALGRVVLVLVPFLVHSAVVNDLADARIDAVNLPADARRVLAGGRAHRSQLRLVAVVALVAALAAGASLGATGLAVTALGVVVATGYSLGPVRLADRGVLASMALPACYVAVPYLLGVVAGHGSVGPSHLPWLAALYVGFIGRIVLKDFRDVRGDALFGKRTFLVRHGRVATCRLSTVCWVVASAGAVLTAPRHPAAMVLGTAATTVLAVLFLHRLSRDPGRRAEEWLISALAVVGRGSVVVLVIPAAAASAGPGPATAVAPVLALGMAALTIGQALDMASRGPALATRGPVAAPEPAARHT
jgi:4-hydroxybenzoate polyprenyltransferase